jgi:hypothetical protein
MRSVPTRREALIRVNTGLTRAYLIALGYVSRRCHSLRFSQTWFMNSSSSLISVIIVQLDALLSMQFASVIIVSWAYNLW